MKSVVTKFEKALVWSKHIQQVRIDNEQFSTTASRVAESDPQTTILDVMCNLNNVPQCPDQPLRGYRSTRHAFWYQNGVTQNSLLDTLTAWPAIYSHLNHDQEVLALLRQAACGDWPVIISLQMPLSYLE